MIIMYRIVGFSLLMGSAASLVSLAALLNVNFREIGLIAAVLASVGLGMAGTVVYYQRESLGEQFALSVVLVAAIALVLFVGAGIQWAF
ncbi:MAG: hypothetical protein J7545_15620 [Roseofilum sp. SBFL]|uniref:hypothetical protein n=1 Tax=Roseofilum sp. SBFL TaxID=2821496 RepID=UPI001B1784B4|nr:hypothetical protein [Roseofilum sp. SBFL]MBP0043376.1 hypothetical protein [Roseofilum sp. SBFL]